MAPVTAGGSLAPAPHDSVQWRARRKQKGAISFADVFSGLWTLLCTGQPWMQLAEKGVPVPGDPVCVSVPRHLLGSLMDVPEELQGGIIWSRREILGLALLSKLKERAALDKAAKNLCYNTLLCY